MDLYQIFYDYDIDDIRRDITCVPYEWSNSVRQTKLRSVALGVLENFVMVDESSSNLTNDDE